MTRPLYASRTAPRPAGEGWRKVPSVTYGGAPFFWYRRNPATDASERYAYDRRDGRWHTTGDDVWNGSRYVETPLD